MKVRFLLDANVLAEPLRPAPNPSVLEHLARHEDEMGIAAITWHEMLFGCYRLPPSEKRRRIERYLFETVQRTLPILPYEETAARWHAQERARLTALGKTPPFADGQIAAVARVQEATLVTANRSDFAHFEGLALADWWAG